MNDNFTQQTDNRQSSIQSLAFVIAVSICALFSIALAAFALSEAKQPCEISFDEKIDYYAGCYRLHKKFSPVPMDLESTNEILDKMEGLEVNRISAPKCCFHPEGLAHMINGVQTKTMLHICTGCYGQALQNMPQDRGLDILMLPDFVERAMEHRRAEKPC